MSKSTPKIEVPSLEELREKYKDAMANKAVTRISGWTEPNSDTPYDEGEYLARNALYGDKLCDKIEAALTSE
jgi:hypothetical protein